VRARGSSQITQIIPQLATTRGPAMNARQYARHGRAGICCFMTNADRKFRPGDVVRLRERSPFWHELKDRDLTVVEVEREPAAMGIQVVWVQGKSGGLPALGVCACKTVRRLTSNAPLARRYHPQALNISALSTPLPRRKPSRRRPTGSTFRRSDAIELRCRR
jgi:hypothetical protein